MGAEDGSILVINAGSSSLKADCYGPEVNTPKKWSIQISGVGQPSADCRIIDGSGNVTTEEFPGLTFELALLKLDVLAGRQVGLPPLAVGHRLVHGGPAFSRPAVIDESVVRQLGELKDLDPEHAPQALLAIEFYRHRYPEAQHIACFDTSFFSDLPDRVKRLPIPRQYYDRGIRRYGFHGLSYQYVLAEFGRRCGEAAAKGRIVIAHLGSGVSLAAISEGSPIDTTMAYSPASGVMMSSRSGDIDPGVYWHLIKNEGLNNDQVKDLLSSQSGLKGVSDLSADMYALLQADAGDPQAAEAVEMFCYGVKKTIGSYVAALGGLDSLIFTGGMGENSAPIRQRVLAGLEFMGIEVDPQRNETNNELISADSSRVGVHVIQTDESRTIVEEINKLIG